MYGKNFHVDINCTRLCNLRCTYCFEVRNAKMENKNFERVDNLYKFIDTLLESPTFKSNYDRVSINFWGGEPLLNREVVIDIVNRYLNDDRVIFFMYSNGYNITERDIKLFRKWSRPLSNLNAQKFTIQISFDGRPVHDFYRVTATKKPTANTVKKNITRLARSGIPYTVKSTISPKDFKYLYDAYRDVIEVSPNYFPSIDLDLDWDENRAQVYVEDLKMSLVKIAAYELKNNVSKFAWFARNKALCAAGADMIAIDTNGNVVPCHGALYMNYDEHIIANIQDEDCLEKILNRREKFLRVFGVQPTKCLECNANFCLRCNVQKFKRSKKSDYFERWTDFNNQEYLCTYFSVVRQVYLAYKGVLHGM